MNLEGIELFLKAVGSKVAGSRSKWILAKCPLGPWNHKNGDRHPSFAIELNEKGYSICKCQSCGFGGELGTLIYEISRLMSGEKLPAYNLGEAMQLIATEDDLFLSNPDSIPDFIESRREAATSVVFPEEWLDTFRPATMFPEAVKYLQDRMICSEFSDWLELKFDPVARRVGFPFRDFDGRLMGVQGRAIDKDNPLRYSQYGFHNQRNAHVWMGENWLDLDKPLIAVEGPFDLTSVMRAYPNVIASFTSGLSFNKLKRIGSAVEVVTFYDFGSGGDSARARIEEFFSGKAPVTHIIPSELDGDAGAMRLSRVTDLLSGVVL